MSLVLVGTSYRQAPVELRERLALGMREGRELARGLAGAELEAVCLSTCNRTELYLAGPDSEAAERDGVAALTGLGGGDEIVAALYRLHDEAAALHLFRVAAGLDSLIPGEAEILGQVRAAAEAGSPGPLLGRLFRQAVHAGKRTRAQTAIGESPASVSSAGAALAERVFGDLTRSRILLLGAGKVGELAARSLTARGAHIAFVAGRSEERTSVVAKRSGATPIGPDAIGRTLEEVDIVVSSTSSPGFVVRAADVRPALRRRKGRPLFLVDLAVPRDLDPAINELDACYLYDIDDLQAVVAETLTGRRREAERAEAIVVEEAERFRSWQASLDVVPAIASLRAWAESVRAGELAKAETRLERLSESERRLVESLTATIVNKLLHLPTVRMKEAAAAADGGVYVDAVRHLFGLPDDDGSQDRLPRE